MCVCFLNYSKEVKIKVGKYYLLNLTLNYVIFIAYPETLHVKIQNDCISTKFHILYKLLLPRFYSAFNNIIFKSGLF